MATSLTLMTVNGCFTKKNLVVPMFKKTGVSYSRKFL